MIFTTLKIKQALFLYKLQQSSKGLKKKTVNAQDYNALNRTLKSYYLE